MPAVLCEGLVAVGTPWSKQVRCAWWRAWWHASRLGRPQARVDLLLCLEQQTVVDKDVSLAFTAAPGNA